MILPDYEILEWAIKERGISRRKLALAVGIPENSLAASFLRRSRLKVEQYAAICDSLDLNPFACAIVMKNGKITPDALEIINYYEKDSTHEDSAPVKNLDSIERKQLYRNILEQLNEFNALGIQEVLHFINILKTNRLYTAKRLMGYTNSRIGTIARFEDMPAELQELYKKHMQEFAQPEDNGHNPDSSNKS